MTDRSIHRPGYLLGGSEVQTYSDRKLLGVEPFLMTEADQVEAQCMAAGYDRKTDTYSKPMSVDEIAEQMQLPHEAIRNLVAPDVAAETKRQEMASVGFAHVKRGR